MNNTPIELTVWKNRWQGMHASMGHWLQAAKRDAHVERQDTLVSLFASLQAFGQSQLEFFLDGISEDSSYRLEPSLEHPWEYALGVTLDQIGYDMDVITRAYYQRGKQVGNADALRQALTHADKLAHAALEPALGQQLVDSNATALTYFQKAVNVRLIPYAAVVMVGIPFSAVSSGRDLLMIPHEVGHYVFREGRARAGRYAAVRLAAALYNRTLQPPAWLMPWLEEIFADIYGCLIGGPVMALSSQDLVLQSTLTDFTIDDGDHPVAALRPEIYLTVLELMGDYPQAVAKLRARWAACLAARGNPDAFCLVSGERVTMAQAKSDIQAVIRTILEDYLRAIWEGKRVVWSDDLAANEEAEALYRKFEQKESQIEKSVAAMPALAVAATRGAGEELQVLRNGKPIHSRKLGNTELWFEAIKEAARQSATSGGAFNVPAEVWLVLLTAGGWATAGPGMPNISS